MELSRRGFLKVTGAAALLVIAKPVYDAVARKELAQANVIKNLSVPATPTAKRYAMVVKTSLCKEGCPACIDACNSTHNIPDFGNPKDEIKWIWTLPYESAFPEQESGIISNNLKDKPFVVMCNHCDNPACVRVCPTQATWKREDGIVMMDYHRCIGCRYCMAACPYGSRSFNWRDPRPFIKEINPDYPTRTRGVVEKCNFCEERLAKNLVPACVEACPEKALVFGDLDETNSPVRALLTDNYSIQRKPELGTRPQVYYIV